MTLLPAPVEAPRPWLALQSPALELANAIAGTDFVPTSLRGNPAAITAAILYGDEVGLGPMQSLAKIAVINGRPTLAAEAQRALILAAGHDLWVEESTVTRCTVAGRRRGSEATSRITWTMDDAKRAKLAGKPPWQLYPRQMLLARASAELARAVFPDAIGGLAATEEMEDADDVRALPVAGGNGQEAAPAPQTRRRRASVSAPASGPPPASPSPDADAEAEQAVLDALQAEVAARPADAPDDEPVPRDERPATEAQKRKLNVLVGTLRDAGHIGTRHLYGAVGELRGLDADQLADTIADSIDAEGVLHWSPLRDSLMRPEAAALIDRLDALEQRVSGDADT